ncbi:MAG: PorT family protein [Bacteroidales bacterium]|nr:PorT family protein [Bacteroidales bacterium]
MKKKLLLVCMMCALVLSANAQRFGIQVGMNLANVNSDGELNDDLLAYQVGPVADFDITNSFAFNTGVLFSAKGCKSSNDLFDTKIGISYVEIPLNLAYKLDLGGMKLYAQAGPYIGYAVANKLTVEAGNNKTVTKNDWEGFKRLDFGVGFGAGAELEHLKIGMAYGLGLANMNDNSDDYKSKNRNFMITAAWLF